MFPSIARGPPREAGGALSQTVPPIDSHHSAPLFGSCSVSNVSVWMDTLNMAQPIPKLVPVRAKAAVTGSTVASSARATLGRNKFESLHQTTCSGGQLATSRSLGSDPLARIPLTSNNLAVSISEPFSGEDGVSPRNLPSHVHISDEHIDTVAGGSSFVSSPAVSPRGNGERSQSIVLARMHSGLFAGMRGRAPNEAADPLSDLRRDLSALFVQDSRAATYFKYLLLFGGTKTKPEYAPQTLSHEEHQLLGLLFGALDRDSDSFVTSDDIKNASQAFHGKFGGGEYSRANFRKMDRNCNGRVDFEQFLLAFFPDHTLLSLRHIRKTLAKPLTKLVCSTKELMAATDYQEVERNFRFFVSVSRNLEDELADESRGGALGEDRPPLSRAVSRSRRCRMEGISLMGYLSVVKDDDARAFAEQLFGLFDTDGDGVLSFDDFLEMMKHNYPPFRKGDRYGVNYGYLEQQRKGGGGASALSRNPSTNHVHYSGRGGNTPRGSGQEANLFAWRDFNEEEKAQTRLYAGIASNAVVVTFPKPPPNKKGGSIRRGSEALASIMEMRDQASKAVGLLKY